MDSRIILTQADFSANNIGRYAELSDLTKKVLAKQTQYSIDSAEATALDTFLNALTENGFIGGESPMLKFLVIPALASQHGELFYNIAKLDGDGYPTNAMPSAEVSAQTKAYQAITDSQTRIVGVKDVRGTLGAEDFNTQTLFDNNFDFEGTTVPNVSMVMYNLYNKTSVSQDDVMVSLFDGFCFIKAKSMGALKTSVNYGYDMTGTKLGFLGITLDNMNFAFNAAADNATLTPNGNTLAAAVTCNSASKGQARIGYSATADARHTHTSFVAWGTDIFSEKMAELKSLVDTLMTALHVKSYITE